MKTYAFRDSGCYIMANERCLGMSHGDSASRADAKELIAQANAALTLTAERDALRAACAAVVASNEGRQSLITATSMCYAALAATPEAGEVKRVEVD